MSGVNSVASNNALPLPTAGAGASPLTLALFQTLPATGQAGFINLNHAGNPPQVVLGPAGSQKGLATLNADGTVTTEGLPSGFTSAPANVDYATFSSWSQNVQAAYMLANSAEASSDDTTLSLTCGSGNATFTAVRPVPPRLYSPSDLTTIQAPDVSFFFAIGSSNLTDLTTSGYTKADIPYENLGAAGGQYTVGTTAQTIAGVAATVYTAAAGTASPSTTSYAYLDPNTFASWTSAQQLAYVQSQLVANPTMLSGGFLPIGAFRGTSLTQTNQTNVYFASGTAPMQILSLPATTNYQTVDPQIFESWTTGQQRAFINGQINLNISLYGQKSTPVNIGASSGTGHAAIDVFIGAGRTAASPAPVYIAQNLQKTDIAKMSFKDQQTLTTAAGYPALAAAYGLMPNATTQASGATSATATIQALIASYRSTVTTSTVPPYVQSLFTAQIDLISAQLFGGALPSAPVAGTTTTVPTAPTPPSPQTSGSAIFSETDIQTQLDAIQTRFKRVAAFAAQATKNMPYCQSFDYTLVGDPTTYHYTFNPADDVSDAVAGETINPDEFVRLLAQSHPVATRDAAGVAPAGEIATSGQNIPLGDFKVYISGAYRDLSSVTNVTVTNGAPVHGGSVQPTSVDNDATIRAGYEKFVAQEAAITANKMLAANLAQSGTVAGSSQSLDMPKLLCLYMMYNYNIQQAVVTADSEEINQVNAVLQEYSSMQQVVNATNGVATSDANAGVPMQFTGTSNEVMYMFNGTYGGSPIENLYLNNSSYARPNRPLYYTGPNQPVYTATANSWTEYGTQLSDVVTQINQQSQIKMNDVNSETKQQDRYLDLASTALSKLSDTLSQIASAT